MIGEPDCATPVKLRRAGRGFWLEAAIWTLGTGAAIAVPTVLIGNRFFIRMTPVRWYDYAFWIAAAPLVGLILAARRLPARTRCRVEGRALAGGGLTYLAVGCPICNKIVVALLGVSGALSYFAPLQPVIGLAAVMLLAFTLKRVLRSAQLAEPAAGEPGLLELKVREEERSPEAEPALGRGG